MPKFFDLTRAGFGPVRLDGELPLAAMRRLTAAVADAQGAAAVELQIFRESDRTVVRGQVQAKLVLACQRCFGDLEFPVQAEFRLAWIRRTAETAEIPAAYEPLLSDSGRVKLAELIEDELLLMLPMAALHEPGACSGNVPRTPAPSGNQAAAAKPFAVLKALKRR